MTNTAKVSTWRYIAIFTVVYIPLMIVAAIILNLIGANSSHGANVACLAAASITAAHMFVKKHKRAFIGAEYWTMLGGSIAIDVIWQSVLAIPVFLSGKLTLVAYLLALAFVGILHGLFLAFMYSSRMLGRYVPKTNP